METCSKPRQSWSRGGFLRMPPKAHTLISAEMGKNCKGVFCQLVRIILPQKIKLDQFKWNNFLGMLELSWLPLGASKPRLWCQGARRLRWPEQGCPRQRAQRRPRTAGLPSSIPPSIPPSILHPSLIPPSLLPSIAPSTYPSTHPSIRPWACAELPFW